MNPFLRESAKREIAESFSLCTFCMQRIGISFDEAKDTSSYIRQKLTFIVSVLVICYHVFSEIVYIGLTVSNSPRVEDVVPLFHTFGYGALSIAKVFVLWYKKDVFGELLEELTGIWPMPPLDDDAQGIKEKSLVALRIAHRCTVLNCDKFFILFLAATLFVSNCWAQVFVHYWGGLELIPPLAPIGIGGDAGYFAVNFLGVWFYNVTPILIYFYRLWQAQDAQIGFVWVSWYPFDKRQSLAHVAVYIFEIFAGQTCVWIMVSTDLLFSGMASHIGLLLRILQRRLESLASTEKSDDEYYADILGNIKLHQRLIRYCMDLEEAFSLVNLINYVLSSVNICCVLFVIVLLEPFMAVSNKLFLMSALIQIGTLCWYADDIFHANQDIALAAYNSRWYRTNPRCRRALLFLIRRSQKPIAFTALNFTNITLVTYSAILTRSYSYFALLYTMYNKN